MNIIEQDLSKLSTIRAKSHAKFFCLPESVRDIEKAIEFKLSNELRHVIIGNGSNILFSKKSYDDILFIKLAGDFNYINIDQNQINIGAAYSLKLAGKELIKNGYSDYSFFNLIPACIGGAITQNAGIGKNKEMQDVCISVDVYDIKKSKIRTLSKEECLFEYRNSIIKKTAGRYIVLSAIFDESNFTENTTPLILEAKSMIRDKVNREPIGYSFGSTFMNGSIPAWECVKEVIDDIDIDNGVSYSEKHKNWIVNTSSSGEDIEKLIIETQKLVKKKLGIELKTEVRIIK